MTASEINELMAKYNKELLSYKDFLADLEAKDLSIEIEEFEVTATLKIDEYNKIPDIRQHLEKYHKFISGCRYKVHHNYIHNLVTFKQKQRRVKNKFEPPKFKSPADYLEKLKERAAKISFINKKRAEENMPPLGDMVSETFIDAEFKMRWEKETKELIEKAKANQESNNQPPKETRQPLDLFSLKDLEEE